MPILDYFHDISSESFEGDICFVDQSPSQEFNINEFGWPRNDISAFELASSESEAELILQRLQEQCDSGLYDGLSEKEMFDLVCPRRAYSDPVLYERYQVKFGEMEANRIKENEERKQKESAEGSKVSFEGTEVPPSE